MRLLEREFAEFCGAAHACAVANGTDALHLALRAYGVGPGDEVVTVAEHLHRHRRGRPAGGGEAGVRGRGARHPHDGPVEARGGDHPAHEGDPARAPLRPPRRHDRDRRDRAAARAARARGRGAGARGRVARDDARGPSATPPASASTRPRTSAPAATRGWSRPRTRAFVARVRQIANHGAGNHRYDNVVLGTNSRLDTLQAAILRVKLRHLERWNAERAARAAAYSKALEGVPDVVAPREREGARSAWHLYTIRVAERDALAEHLRSRGIGTAIHYPRPIHLQALDGAPAGEGGRPARVGAALARGALPAALPRAPARGRRARRGRGARLPGGHSPGRRAVGAL